MPARFHSIYFETTRRCNFSCPYCSSGSQWKDKNYGKELEFDEIIKLLFIPSRKLGSRFIVFSGGEFLLREDAVDLLKEAHKMGFRIGLASNGSTITQNKIDVLRNAVGKNLLVSLGVNEFSSANIETRDVSEDFIRDKIKLLQENKISVNLSVTLSQFNKDTFAQTVEEIRKLGLPYNRIPFVPRNCDAKELMLDKNTLKNYFHPVLNKYFNGFSSFHPLFLAPEDYARFTGQHKNVYQVPTNPSVGCWVGSYFAVTPEGAVSPCPLFADQISGGNIRETSLKKILFESEVFVKITDRKQLKGKCGTCKYNFTCGGCRVMSYYLTGDFMAEDPTCFIQDLSVEELSEIEKQTAVSFRNYVRMASRGGLFDNPEKE
ncbi:MAG: radical SAM protein [Bacteroidales bacterium]|nr:radical SAM protein [Bacteroidales bacterium]